jgi:hypothetical protein
MPQVVDKCYYIARNQGTCRHGGIIGIKVHVAMVGFCDKVYQSHATGRWFSTGFLVFSINKTDHHDITEKLLKVVLNTILHPLLASELSHGMDYKFIYSISFVIWLSF